MLIHRIVLAIFALCATACNTEPSTDSTPPPAKVASITVALQDLPLHSAMAGRARAMRVSEVRPQVGGIIEKRFFDEGSTVVAGDRLYQINADSYQAAVDHARAERNMAQAALVNLNASVDRYRALLASNVVSHQEYDLALANFHQGEARLAASAADLKVATINLARTRINAPISGTIGRSSVGEGALVAPAQGQALATIQQLDPIYVDMLQSSQQFLALKRRFGANGLQDGGGQVRLTLPDGQHYKEIGVLQFAEMRVDQATGSVTLRARFANPNQLLLPGMYLRARVEQGVETNVALIPQQALIYNPGGEASVWVVGRDHTAQQRIVTVAASHGDHWLVREGLSTGERVIVEGLQRVYPGQSLAVSEWTQVEPTIGSLESDK